MSYEYLFFNDNGTIDTKFYICLFDDGSYSMAKKTDYFDRKNNVVIDIYEQDNQIIQKEKYTLYDTVSSSGIVSCEKIGSEENEEFGIHTITKYEVLENEDEILKTFFWSKEIKEYWGFKKLKSESKK